MDIVTINGKNLRTALLALLLQGSILAAQAQIHIPVRSSATAKNAVKTTAGAAANTVTGSVTGTSPDADASDSSKPHKENEHVNVGLTYPVSTNWIYAKEYANRFSLNALIGLSSAESGFTVAGLSNIIFDSAGGLQIAGLSNHIGNRARGVQIAGLLNATRNSSEGVQIAGLLNVTGSSSGVSLAGFGNVSRRNASGAQVAGFINTAANAGNQVAGFLNNAANAGNQVAGFFNKATDANNQVAGGINIARKVKGAQIAGLLNIADSSEYPVALFNFVKNGEKTIGVSTDETLTTLATFRSGSHRMYGIAGVGYNHKGSRSLTAWEAGLGMHFLRSEHFRLNVEAVSMGLTDFTHGDNIRHTLRILPSWRITDRIEIYGGPSYNYFYAKSGFGADVVDHLFWSKQNERRVKGMYVGLTGGVQVRL